VNQYKRKEVFRHIISKLAEEKNTMIFVITVLAAILLAKYLWLKDAGVFK